jgi:hypothetical protein
MYDWRLTTRVRESVFEADKQTVRRLVGAIAKERE